MRDSGVDFIGLFPLLKVQQGSPTLVFAVVIVAFFARCGTDGFKVRDGLFIYCSLTLLIAMRLRSASRVYRSASDKESQAKKLIRS